MNLNKRNSIKMSFGDMKWRCVASSRLAGITTAKISAKEPLITSRPETDNSADINCRYTALVCLMWLNNDLMLPRVSLCSFMLELCLCMQGYAAQKQQSWMRGHIKFGRR